MLILIYWFLSFSHTCMFHKNQLFSLIIYDYFTFGTFSSHICKKYLIFCVCCVSNIIYYFITICYICYFLFLVKSYSDVFSIPGKTVFFGTYGRSSERDVIWIGPRQKTDWGMCVKISRQENETEDNDCLACPPTHYWNAEKLQYTHIATTLYRSYIF